ncbi:Hypothetical protein HDN1F_05080 [gamma proteobacterium HdN1]|nr:Hypothetical protein HDN1F_05080 [gamma proteobacterium HdN1]
MTIRLELAPSNSGPGKAILSVYGWKGDLMRVSFIVQRNQDSHYLTLRGAWGPRQEVRVLGRFTQEGDALTCEVGADLVDPLLSDPQSRYLFELYDQNGNRDRGVLRMVGTLFSSQAAGNSLVEEIVGQPESSPPEPPRKSASVPAPMGAADHSAGAAPSEVNLGMSDATLVAPTPTAPFRAAQLEPSAPDSKPPRTPDLTDVGTISREKLDISALDASPLTSNVSTGGRGGSQNPAPPKRWPFVLLAVLLLALIGFGAAWYSGLLPGFGLSLPNVTSLSTGTSSSPSPASGPCGVDAMKGGDDLQFIQSCMGSSPKPDDVLAIIASAKQAGRCNIMQRLYAYNAQAGNVEVAVAYAREYDPETFQKNTCIDSADADTAAYWYEVALNKDPNHQVAKDRLAKLTGQATP